ncbi:MAG TPA: MG2 domain-containing protein [Burkholderiaceae bacterium]|nr:MG2 domain-containing protein [Burkholderiaceae bacterium]
MKRDQASRITHGLRRVFPVLALGLTALLSTATSSYSHASTQTPEVAEFLPQGRVSAVEAVKLSFMEPVAAFGDGAAKAPVVLQCDGLVPAGAGRWLDDRRWTYVFDSAVGAGVRCAAHANPEFKTLQGHTLPSDVHYEFDTGAPTVTDLRPYASSTIDEDQIFILRFNAPVDAEAIAKQSRCIVEGVGERIPVRAAPREYLLELLDASYMAEPADPDTIALLRCARVLPPEAKLSLEVGPGVRATGQPSSLPGSETAQVWDFKVRPPFTAKIRCTREKAGSPCLPITPIVLEFTAPVPREAWAGVKLSAGEQFFEAEEDEEETQFVETLRFPGPFPPSTKLTLSMPVRVQDDAGRVLENEDSFPKTIPVADYPPLAKFSSGTFGVIERFAQSRPGAAPEQAAVPVTLRHVEANLATRGLRRSPGTVSRVHGASDAEVLNWYSRLQRLDSGRWSADQVKDIVAGRAPRQSNERWESLLDYRAVSLLADQADASRMTLPAPAEGQWRPFEVVGIPLETPGFHILEIESPRLGSSLLEDGAAMYVRTGVLLTNLSVHLKQGSDDLLVWVTTLSDARAVAGADISVLDCNGESLLTGRSDDNGIWHHMERVEAPDYCPDTGLNGLFVSASIPAEHPLAHGKADYSFVMSGWDRGIETWRFNLPTNSGREPIQTAHTVFDRTLFRAGEIVSMKHYLREQTRQGLLNPGDRLPNRLVIEHEGSSQSHELEVKWEESQTGGLYALNTFQVPDSAHLGLYTARLTDAESNWFGSNTFRVEEFRLPLMTGQLSVSGEGRPDVLVAPDSIAVDVQLAWLSGGPAMGQQVEITAMAEDRGVYLVDYEDYSFDPAEQEQAGLSSESNSWDQPGPRRQIFAEGIEARLDETGRASISLDTVPKVERPRRFLLEAAYADPNGEIQTLSQSVDVWPAAVLAGIKAPSWYRSGQAAEIGLLALGIDGKPRAGVEMQLQSVERKVYTVRKRMVGGFYRYDSHLERSEPETVCSGTTDENGQLTCNLKFQNEGNFELVAVAADEQGRQSQSQRQVWVSGAADLWFPGADDDRIDLIPAKREWVAGEEAEFQVRMPFRDALALVSVEREGVLWSRQVRLKGNNPVIRVPVSEQWGPNAFVSVLVLRGRLYELPWQSFFDWGWRRPDEWLNTYKDRRDDALVTSQVDLAKPSFRLGIAELKVSGQADRLKVEVRPERDVLKVREETSATIRVTLPDGSPAAHGTVAFAVVDEALLELASNDSWKLYEAMHPRRSLRVSTASNQLEVVGRRHYGRKAVAAGGGGGSIPTRQLFDTLLSWQPVVQLDANGEAQVRFRVNDSISRFRLVALAEHGAGLFGTADTSVVSRQALQLVSGLPPVVREGDRYLAQVTLRNGADSERDIRVEASVGDTELAAQPVKLGPGQSGMASWHITVPPLLWPEEQAELQWHFQARGGEIVDRIAVTQRVEPRSPLVTVQATLISLEAGEATQVPVAAPAHAEQNAEKRVAGGLALNVAPTLVNSLEGVREWWERYPYTCLEQRFSQAIALEDPERWQAVSARLATHMDDAGLLRYFPGTAAGSVVLTAYLASVSQEAAGLVPGIELPPQLLDRMLDALQAFAEGRMQAGIALSGSSLEAQRLMAMSALARHGRLAPGMVRTLGQSPEHWPTASVVDWLSILLRMPQRDAWKKEIGQARNILRARMTVSGEQMVFAERELNATPELMATPASNLSSLLLTVMEQAEWRTDVPHMVKGLLSLQRGGAWSTTTENLLGRLALARYGQAFEAEAAQGDVVAALEGKQLRLPLEPTGDEAVAHFSWPTGQAQMSFTHAGQGRAWVSLRAQAPVRGDEPESIGYQLTRAVVPVQRKHADHWSPGDIYRVELTVRARDSGRWVVVDDPIPAGASILGSGLGRDAAARSDARGEGAVYPPTYVERTASAYRAYFEYFPAGSVKLVYTVRLNAAGSFGLPPTRVEALYQPDLRGSLANPGRLIVGEGLPNAPAN